VALFAAGGGGAWWMSRPEPSAPTPQTQATATPPAATGSDTPGVTAQSPPGTEPTAAQLSPTVQAVTTADAPSPKPVAATPQVIPGLPRPTARPEPKENLPEEVRQLLDEAESALKAGNTEEAIRLAKRSQRTKSDVRPVASYSILTRAYCLRKDLGAAKGEWPKVSASEKPRIRQLCKQYDIEF
jgi:serine/threonine-protein kinase